MSGTSTRYSPADFAYNGRVAMALVPCLAAISILGGRSVIAVLALGSVAGYMMDVMQYRDGAYTASWLTLFATACAFSITVFSSSHASLLAQIALVLAVIFVMVLCAMWASLQFKYFQMHKPAVALAFERLVITGSLPAAAIMHTIGLSLFVDVSDLPYYLAVIISVLYGYLGRPLRSSFVSNRAQAAGSSSAAGSHSKAAISAAVCIQNRADSALMALITVSLPAMLYTAIHWELFFRHPVHLYSVILCGSLPALVMSLMPSGMWWVPGGQRLVKTVQTLTLVLALFGSVVGFEGRVVFHSFGQYIKLPPPWNWVAVTVCLLGVATIVLLAQQGILGNSVDVTVAGSALLLCTTAGALAAGVPFQWLPAPLVAACGLALFFDSRSLREYIVFVAGAFMTGIWFVLQHFWLLNISVGGLTLHSLCRLALAAMLPALMIPGLVYARVPAPALDALIMLQALLVCVLEERLYVPSHSDFSAESMYPGYLVVATSALGIMASRLLVKRGHITQFGNWLAHGIFGTKPIMLLLPEASLVLPTALLVLSASAPVFLTPYMTGSAAVARRRVRVPLGVGLGHLVSTLIALILARFAVFDVVQFLLSSRPPEGLLLGALVLTCAASLAPLVVVCYPGNLLAQRCLATLTLSGVLMVLLQPPLPLRGGAACPSLPLALCPRLWDERHVPLHDVEDAEVWGTGLARKEHWPRWLLFAAVTLGAAAGVLGGAAGRAARVHHGVSAAIQRLIVACVTGGLVGAYIALEVVPNQMVLQVLVGLSCLAVVAFVCLLPLPSVRGPLLLPALAGAWLVLFGFTMLLQSELAPPEAPVEMQRMFPDSHKQVEEEIEAATRAALLAVFASQAAVLALALKLHVSATLKAQDAGITAGGDGLEANGRAGGFPSYLPGQTGRGADLFCGVVPLAAFGKWGRALKLEASSCGPLLQRLGGAGLGWAPSLGSACALLAYVMCVSLNVQITGGAPEALFMAAPLLLLMQQDPLLAPGLTAARRYVVPFTATCISLLICCMASIVALMQAEETMGYHIRVVGQAKPLIPLIGSTSVVTHAVQQAVLALAPMAGAGVLTMAMWTHKTLPVVTQVWAGGLCVLTLLTSPQPAAWYLAGTVVVSSLLHHVSMSHTRKSNARII